MTHAVPGRDPNLPRYLDCQTCDGDGEIWRCSSGCFEGLPLSSGPGGDCCRPADCPRANCLGGSLLCASCLDEGIEPRCPVQGPNFIINIGAIGYDSADEPACARHLQEDREALARETAEDESESSLATDQRTKAA